MGDSRGLGKLSNTPQEMRANLEVSLALALKGEHHYSTRFYFFDLPGLPAVVTCFAACTSNAVAKELHDKIVDLLRNYFPGVPESTPDRAN